MRSAALATAVCVFCLCQNAQAHGPSNCGHPGGGQAGGGQFHHKPDGGPAGVVGGARANLGQLHPSALNGINGQGGNASSAISNGTSSQSTSGLSSNGSRPPAGEIARIQHLEQELRRLKMEDALLLLQQAKQSGNPQLLAQAEQMLHHRQHNRSQQGGNGNASGPSSPSSTKATPWLNGSQAINTGHPSHTSAGGHSSGHGHH